MTPAKGDRARSRMLKIAILLHRYDAFESGYWLHAIAEDWRDSGIGIELLYGPQARADADLAVLHVDLTTIPAEYMDHISGYRRVVNGGVGDISKRRISTNLLRRGDPHDGPVIVKTDRNHRGGREWHFAKKGLLHLRPRDPLENYSNFAKEAYRLGRHWWRHGSPRAFRNYPVFNSTADVPDAVWDDCELIVERFLPERRGEHYCVRTWLFFGDRERHAIFFSRSPIINSTNIVDFERLADVPEELRRRREELKFDYGKFDYAMVDGRPVLYDANRTPSIGAFPRERYFPIAQSLAGGIKAFL